MKLTIQSVVLTTMLLCSFVLFGQEKNAESTYVENEFIIWLMQDVDAQQFAIRADAGISLRSLIPDDPYFEDQWGSVVMQLPQAWEEFGTGGLTVTGDTIVVAGSSENEDADEATIVEAYGYALEMRARYNETDGAEGAFIVSTNSSFGVDYGQTVMTQHVDGQAAISLPKGLYFIKIGGKVTKIIVK